MASAVFLLASPPVLTRGVRVQDAALLVLLGGLALQVVALPAGLVDAVSPRARLLGGMLAILPDDAGTTLSIHPALTWEALPSAATAILVFWTARGLLRDGGTRSLARTFAAAALVLAVVGLAQRATAPQSLLWLWTPLDAGARPMGPFVNRNHFAMWMVMASALAAGALAAHLTAHTRRRGDGSTRLAMVAWLEDTGSAWLGGTFALLWLTVIASGSRGGMVSLVVFAVAWLLVSGRRMASRRTGLYAGLAFGLILVAGVAANAALVAERLGTPGSGGGVQRTEIWMNTLPVIRDFWLTGTGGGTYASAMVLYQQSARFILFNEAHSEYLQLVTEGGLLLTLPAVIWLAAWGHRAWRSLREDQSGIFWLRSAAFAGLVAVGSQCVWDSALRMPANAVLAAVLAALVVHERPEGPDAGRRARREAA